MPPLRRYKRCSPECLTWRSKLVLDRVRGKGKSEVLDPNPISTRSVHLHIYTIVFATQD